MTGVLDLVLSFFFSFAGDRRTGVIFLFEWARDCRDFERLVLLPFLLLLRFFLSLMLAFEDFLDLRVVFKAVDLVDRLLSDLFFRSIFFADLISSR